jgi:hypothetical protein
MKLYRDDVRGAPAAQQPGGRWVYTCLIDEMTKTKVSASPTCSPSAPSFRIARRHRAARLSAAWRHGAGGRAGGGGRTAASPTSCLASALV